MELNELVEKFEGFKSLTHSEKIKLLGWHLHTYKNKISFQPKDITGAYNSLHLSVPTNLHSLMDAMTKKKNKDLLRNKDGYRLELSTRSNYDKKFPKNNSQAITTLLSDLPNKVNDLDQKVFLNEAITCFRNGAFRASIVMSWNLAYHHLCCLVLKDSKKLDEFNKQWLLRYPKHHKSGTLVIAKIEDVSDFLKESEFIEICSKIRIFDKNVHKLLVEKLTKRNAAAHPSSLIIETLQAEAYIDDLVKNVILKLGSN